MGTVQRGESFDVIINTKLQETMTEDVPLWAAVKRYDEIVAYTQKQPRIATSQREAGKSYQDTITVSIPGFAPDGEYEIICGAGTACEDGFYGTGIKTVGSITVGEGTAEAVQSVTFADVSLKSDTKLTASFTISQTSCTENKKAYVKLWKDEVLWGVAISDNAPALKAGEYELQFEIPYGMPSGTYSAELGFFGVSGSIDAGEIEIASNYQYGYKPLSNGIYNAKRTDKEHFWYVNQENALIWDGEPYIPMGAMECLSLLYSYSSDMSVNENLWAADKAEIDVIAENGMTDLYINTLGNKAPAWVWEHILDYLDDKGICYSIQPAGISPKKMEVFYIHANPKTSVVSVTDIVSDGAVTAAMKISGIDQYGTGTALFGICTLIDENGTTVQTQKCTLEKSDTQYVFTADIVLPSEGTYKAVFTPFVSKTNSLMCNFWDYREECLSKVKSFAESIRAGDNLRAIIDPVSNESGYYNGTENMRPYSESYNAMYEKWLEDKYTSTASLNEKWGTSGLDFKTASRLIPVYSGDTYLYASDPENSKIYCLDIKNGIMWFDYQDFKCESTAEFYNEVANTYKETLDIPIIVKNVWGHKEYFINKSQVGGIDGLGTEAYGSYSRIANLQTETYGMTAQFAKTAWNVVTETQNNEDINDKYESEDYGYESESYMHSHFDTLIEHGAKGIFDFLFSARHHEKTHVAYSYISNPAQFEWLRNYSQKLDKEKIAEYVPEKSKVWFMPFNSNFYTVPNSITSVLKSDIFKAPKQSQADDELMLMVSGNPSDEAQIIAANFEDAPASVYYGDKFKDILLSMSNRQAVYMGFRKDIGTVEDLDEFFTDEYVYNDENVLVQVLKPIEGTQIIKETSDGKPWVIRHKNLWIVSAKDAPDTSYMSYLEEIGILMNDSDYVWRDYCIKSGDSKYEIDAQLQNNTSDVSDASVIMAAYDSYGELVRVKAFEQPIMKGFNSIKAELEVSENDSLIKGFVWDINMKPLNTAVFLNK